MRAKKSRNVPPPPSQKDLTMRSARLLPVIALGSGVAVLVSPATAAPKKPITKSFSVSIPVPFPANQATSACETSTKGPSEHNEVVKVPAAGMLDIQVTEITGDWDMVVTNAKGQVIAEGAGVNSPNVDTGNTERAKVKVKKADTLTIQICNFAGGPTGKGKYTFTYAK